MTIAAVKTCAYWPAPVSLVQEWRGNWIRLCVFCAKPSCVISGNGTGFTSRAILKWAGDNDVDWHYIDPGNPWQIAFIESFNSSPSDTLLNEEIFDTLDDTSRKPAIWRYAYNNVRPHSPP